MSETSSSAPPGGASSASSVVSTPADPVYAPPAHVSAGAHVSSLESYKALYGRSIADPKGFWGEMARTNLTWFRDFTEV